MKKIYLIQLIRILFIFILVCNCLAGFSQAHKDSTKSHKVQQVEIVTFKPGTSEANQHFVDNSFRNSLQQLPILGTFISVIGNDAENNNQVKHVYITTFNSKGDLTTYNASPQHQAAKKTNSAYIDNVVTVSYPVDK
jgi:hypothetical protein